MVKRCHQVRGSDGDPAIISACSLCPDDVPCVYAAVTDDPAMSGRRTTLADLPAFKAPETLMIDDDSEQAAQANDPQPVDPAMAGESRETMQARYVRWRGVVSALADLFDVQPVGNIQQRGSIPGTVKLTGNDGYVFDLVDMLDGIADVIDDHGSQLDALRGVAEGEPAQRGKKNARIARLEQEVSRLRHDAEHRSQTIGDLQTRIVRFDKRVCDLELTSKGIPVDNTSYVIEEKGDGAAATVTNWRAEINGTERAIGQIMDRLDEHHVELGKIMPPGGDMPTLAEAWRHIHRLNESALRNELRANGAFSKAADAAAMADHARSITDERIDAAVRLVLLGSSTADGTALEQMGKELGEQITVAIHVALDDLIAAKVAEQIKEMRENATEFAQATTQAHEAIERRRDELERQRITPLLTEAELLAFAGKVLEIVDTGRNETDMADRLVQEASDLRDGRHGVSDPMGS